MSREIAVTLRRLTTFISLFVFFIQMSSYKYYLTRLLQGSTQHVSLIGCYFYLFIYIFIYIFIYLFD